MTPNILAVRELARERLEAGDPAREFLEALPDQVDAETFVSAALVVDRLLRRREARR